ncbi:MAG: hypothetical protein P4L57_07355 [Rhizomicrobium sp.]|nr:hypothetical protein [Rhizomicrobium sp.]
MPKLVLAALASVFLMLPVQAQTKTDSGAADPLKSMINSPSADSWSGYGATFVLRDDPAVQAGKAMRITVAKKGANPYDSAAWDPIVKPVSKGDVILVAYWARAEEPPTGKETVSIPNVTVGLNKAPYTAFGEGAATITRKWTMYYASGVADADYKPGKLVVNVQLGSDIQVVDLGPVFVLDYGPDYDQTKLPHNKVASAAAPTAVAASPEVRFADALTKLRAKLPTKGKLISDPGQTPNVYGPDQTSQAIDAADVPGGKAVRAKIAKAGANPWDDGVSQVLTGDIKKGDTVFMAAYLRAHDANAQIAEIGVHTATAPWSPVATATAVSLPANQWQVVYASGVATTDYAASGVNAMLQLGAAAQSVDIGPIFVLNLGPGVATAGLPKN